MEILAGLARGLYLYVLLVHPSSPSASVAIIAILFVAGAKGFGEQGADNFYLALRHDEQKRAEVLAERFPRCFAFDLPARVNSGGR